MPVLILQQSNLSSFILPSIESIGSKWANYMHNNYTDQFMSASITMHLESWMAFMFLKLYHVILDQQMFF